MKLKFGTLVAMLAAVAFSVSASASVPIDNTIDHVSPIVAAAPPASGFADAKYDYTIKNPMLGGHDTTLGVSAKKKQVGGTVPRHPAGGLDPTKIVAALSKTNGNLFFSFDKRTASTGLKIGATSIGYQHMNGTSGKHTGAGIQLAT